MQNKSFHDMSILSRNRNRRGARTVETRTTHASLQKATIFNAAMPLVVSLSLNNQTSLWALQARN